MMRCEANAGKSRSMRSQTEIKMPTHYYTEMFIDGAVRAVHDKPESELARCPHDILQLVEDFADVLPGRKARPKKSCLGRLSKELPHRILDICIYQRIPSSLDYIRRQTTHPPAPVDI